MKIPMRVMESLVRAGADIEIFIQAIAYHEGAHAAVALHHGALVEKIELAHEVKGPVFSAARVVSKAGNANLLQQVEIIAAGPACDSLLRNRFPLPQSILESTEANERASVDPIVRNQQPALYEKARPALDAIWRQSIARASEVLSISTVASFLESMGAHILQCLKDGDSEIPGDRVSQMWLDAGNHFKNNGSLDTVPVTSPTPPGKS